MAVKQQTQPYSLRNGFRGALCGALVGEAYGLLEHFLTQDKSCPPDGVQLGGWRRPTGDGGMAALQQDLTARSQRLASLYARSLIQRGDVDPQDLGMQLVQWRELDAASGLPTASGLPALAAPDPWLDAATAAAISRLRAGIPWHKASGTGAAARTLPGIARLVPVALFFHEDLTRLREKVYQATVLTHNTLDAWYAALAVAHAIALALRRELQPATLVTQTLSYLQDETATLSACLRQVDHLLQARASLERALLHLPLEADPAALVALAFYCFLTTPDDFEVAVLRSGRCEAMAATVASLCGSLSGAYNGWTSIPVAWRLSGPAEASALADQLLAAWAGVYRPETTPTPEEAPAGMSPLVAAPGILRPRPVS